MNFSQERYWLRVNESGNIKVKGSRGVGTFFQPAVEEPRIQDFNMTQGSNLTGFLRYRNGTGVPGERVRLRRRATAYSGSRIPYSTAPPEMTTTTNSSGGYAFSGLQAGEKYVLDLNSTSHVVRGGTPSLEAKGISIKAAGVSKRRDLNASPEVGNLSVELLGEDESNTRYALLASNQTRSGSEGVLRTGISPGNTYNLTLRNTSYRVLAGKFDFSNSSFPDIVTESRKVKVNKGATRELSIGFPALVTVDGYVETPSGVLSDGRIVVRNRTERNFYTSGIGSDGTYSLEVENQTGYTFEVQPPTGSEYRSTSVNLDINGNTSNNFTVSKGSFIQGNITAGVQGLGGVYVDAWNGTENVYGEARTSRNGSYNITGLKSGLNYTVIVQPPPRYQEKESTVEVTGNGVTKDFDLSGNTYELSITVEDESSNDLNATVKLRGEELGVRRKKGISGNGSFTGLQEGVYRVQVDPENGSYSEEREFVYLESNDSVSFDLPVFSGVKGKVRDNSTGNGIDEVIVYAFNYSRGSFDSDETDGKGNYELELTGVNHTVELFPTGGQNYRSRSLNLTSSEISSGSKDINLTKGKSLSGTIEDSQGNGLSGFISLYNSSADSYGYLEFESGSYTVRGLEKTGYNAYVSVEDPKFSARTFKVSKAEVGSGRNFTFGKNKGPELRVVVRDESGGTLANATVTVRGDVERTTADGDVNFGKQPNKESVTVKVGKENYNTSSRTVKIKKKQSTGLGGTKTVSIQNESFTLRNVQGELKDYNINLTEGSTNVSEATVVARSNLSASSRTSSAITGSEGTATLEDLVPGSYLVTVSDGDSLDSRELDLENSVNKTFSLGDYVLGVESVE